MKIVRRKLPSPPAKAGPEPLEKRLLHFEHSMDLEAPGVKAFTAVKDGDQIVDYQDVTLKGYLSTFQATTPSDRDGDYVVPGAFSETIPQFMKNPVLLVNHRNAVEDLAGRFTIVKEDAKGLYVEAVLSNSPAEWTKDVRFKVAEGHLRTLSMGGWFTRGEDGRAIQKVALWEGSLTPVPANPDAIFSTRALTAEEMKKARAELK